MSIATKASICIRQTGRDCTVMPGGIERPQETSYLLRKK